MTTTERPAPGRSASARGSRWRPAMPPQHGAWAFLALPLLLGLVVSGLSWPGVAFAFTWVCAYPASYYVGRALVVRWRRGSWSRIARREFSNALPWLAVAAAGAVVLVVASQWLLAVWAVLVGTWLLGLGLSYLGRERGFGNDMLLIGQSLVALPLMWLVTSGQFDLATVPTQIWLAMAACAVYFMGSVIHVKSLIRESADRRWRAADIVFHVCALAMAWLSPWLLIPFAACLARSVAMRPGLRPAVIGAVEIVMSVLVAVFAFLAMA